MSHSLAMLLPVMHNCTFRTTVMVRKKARECPFGHVQNILPVMTSLLVTSLHVTSFPVMPASGDVTSSNAYAMARSPLLPPEIFLELSRYTTLIFGFGGTLYITHEKISKDGIVLSHLGLKTKV
jgi:hypothetical protein